MKLFYKSMLGKKSREIGRTNFSGFRKKAQMILYSAIFLMAGSKVHAQYCTSGSTSTGDELITNVTMGSLNNTSSCGTLAPGAGSIANSYSNYTTLPAVALTIGNTYTSSVTVNTCGGYYGTWVNTYIDWNGDQDFLDANETVYTSASIPAGATLTYSVTVPTGAVPGVTRMRVVHVEYSAPSSCGAYGYGETEDYNVNIVASSACSGAPTGGTTVSSVATPCPTTSYTMTLSGASTSSGITYQWQSSTDGITYSDISGATLSYYTTTATVNTYYQCILTCTSASLSATSTPVQVTVNSFLNCYCTSNATSTFDEEILNVSLGSLNNSSSCGVTGGPGSMSGQYSNYTNATPAVAVPNLVQGFVYPFGVEIGTCNGNYGNMTKVWIDYNQNGSFLDAGEEIYASPTFTTGPHTETANITIPMTATLGTTRMRVVTVENNTPTPCGTYSWGETEDYFVNIAMPLAIDAGITEFINPVVPTCDFTDSVRVVITNFGSDTLTSCTINWSHNVTNIQTPILWSGSLPQFGSDTIAIGMVAYSGGDDLSAWTSLPNLTTENPAGAYNDQTDIFGLVAGLNGTYTIGGTAPDFATIPDALTALNFAGVCGPTIFDIRAGTYTGQYEFLSANGMSATNTVTFRSEDLDQNSVTLEYAGTSITDNYTLMLNGADYYNFEHLTVTNTGSTYGRVVYVKGGADHNSFKNVRMTTSITTSTSSYVAVVYSDNSLDNYNSFEECSFVGGSYGVYWNGSGVTSLEEGCSFVNNEFESNYYMGIYSWYQKVPVYNNNRIFGTSAYTSRYGLYLGYNQGGIQFNNNSIEGDATSFFTYGLYLYYSDALPANRALVSNNSIVVGKPGITSTTNYGLYIYNCGFTDFVNNSVNSIEGTANSKAAYVYDGALNKLLNNNLVCSGTGFAVYAYGSYSLTDCDYNNYKTNGTNVGYYNANTANLVAWQAASGMDAHSLSVTPGFYSDFDLHVCSDSIDGKATTFSGLTEDLEGNARNASTPDMGAYEFAPLQSSGFLGPDMTICVGDTIVLVAGSATDSIEWNNGPTTPSNAITVPGTYDVAISGACGVSVDEIVITASALNYTNFIVADTTVFCEGGSVVLTTSIPATTYLWTGSSTDDSLTVTSGGVIICNITDACGSGSQSITITEQSAPIASFTFTSNYMTYAFNNTSTNNGSGTTYSWNFGDLSPVSNVMNPTHIFPSAGSYNVTLTATNSCGSSSVTQIYSVVGLEEVAAIGAIGVYPNPSNGLYNVDFELSNDLDATILVTNVLGESVFVRDLGNISGASNSVIDITNAAPGVYYVSILSNDKSVYNTRVVKQ